VPVSEAGRHLGAMAGYFVQEVPGAMNTSTLPAVLVALALAAGGLGVGLLLRHTVLGRLQRKVAATPSRTDDVIISSLRVPVVVWCTLLGFYVAAQIITLPPSVAAILQRGIIILAIISVTWAIARLAGALMEHVAAHVPGRLPSATLLTNLAKLSILGLGLLIILQTLKISITPLITALGIGGLAVGLALQDTLANVFAGLHILTSRQVRRGDYVKLSTGEEGYVQDVTWRYTTVRQRLNNLTIVPNAKLASAVITNYYLPNPELAVLVPVAVSYDSNLERVEEVTAIVALEVMVEVPGGVPEFEPFIRFQAFGRTSIEFTVVLRARDIEDQDLIRHEFIKRLHQRYHDEGIEIPVRRAEPMGQPVTVD
jgi:small-conductance mechanosensitive channel